MNNALIISNIVLWVLVIGLSILVYALLRQIGVLYERVAPAGALMIAKGAVVGQAAPVHHLNNINGAEKITLGGVSAGGRSTLVFFLSPTCPVCDVLVPTLKLLAKAESAWLDVVFASDGDEAVQATFIQRKGLGQYRYVLSSELGMSYQIAKLPYGVLIDAEGITRAHGLINSREHIESLFEAMDRGIASIQEYMREVNS